MVIIVAIGACREKSRTGKKPELSESAKNVFFTDQRGFDQRLVDEDLQRLSGAIGENEDDARLLVARWFIYAALTKFDEAIIDFEKAASLDPNVDTADPEGPTKRGVEYLLALAYWQSGDPEKAIERLNEVITENPKYPRGFFYRGLALLEIGDRKAAIADIETAANMAARSFDFWPINQVLVEVRGQHSRERIFATYVTCFQSTKPPQNRPFGYVWQIQHEVPQDE